MPRPEPVHVNFFKPSSPSIRKEVAVAGIILALWAGLGYGIPILIWLAGLGDPSGLGASFMTRTRFLGFPLHYWLVAQGCTIGFVLLCKLYCILWDRRLHRAGRSDQRAEGKGR